MGTNTIVEAGRASLGPVGVLLPVSFTSTAPIDRQRAALRGLEELGYRTAWTNEVIGKDAFTQLAVLLAGTERMTFATGITNIWVREPQTANAAAALLAQAYPGRFVLGLGVGYPAQAASVGREFGRPLATIRDYLARMDGQTWPPAPDASYPRLIAANGPKMLALAGEIADGALPAGSPPEFTTLARKLLGPDKLLVAGLSVIVGGDSERARQAVTASLALPGYADKLAGLGYPEQDITEVSDRLVDAIIGHGDPAAIAAKVREHLAAGADHVEVMLPVGTEFDDGIEQLRGLAPELTRITA